MIFSPSKIHRLLFPVEPLLGKCCFDAKKKSVSRFFSPFVSSSDDSEEEVPAKTPVRGRPPAVGSSSKKPSTQKKPAGGGRKSNHKTPEEEEDEENYDDDVQSEDMDSPLWDLYESVANATNAQGFLLSQPFFRYCTLRRNCTQTDSLSNVFGSVRITSRCPVRSFSQRQRTELKSVKHRYFHKLNGRKDCCTWSLIEQ
jgi:hypothetical protein